MHPARPVPLAARVPVAAFVQNKQGVGPYASMLMKLRHWPILRREASWARQGLSEVSASMSDAAALDKFLKQSNRP